MRVNVRGVFLMSRAVVPTMIAQRSGSIINMSSAIAETGLARRVSYAASKGAVYAMTKSMQVDLAAHGVRVNALLPDDHQVVHRVERVPVREPREPVGIEDRGLAQGRSGFVAVDLELQPDAPGGLHLGREPQETILLESLHAPEVEGVSDSQPNRIPASAAQTDAADDRVQEAAQPPEGVCVVPARLAADPLNRRERPLRRRRNLDPVRCDGPPAECHAAPVSPSVRRQRVRPPGLGELPVLVRERALDRPADASRTDRKRPAGRSISDERVVAQAVDQFAADARVDRRHEAQPKS